MDAVYIYEVDGHQPHGYISDGYVYAMRGKPLYYFADNYLYAVDGGQPVAYEADGYFYSYSTHKALWYRAK